ncbi:MAG: hypothetical protein Q8O32_03110 [bacterium]|nr:hypothetical protein [bacterium]
MTDRTNSMRSTIGVNKDVMFALLEAIEDFGGEEGDIRRILKEPELRKDIALRLLMGTPYVIDVNISSIKELVAVGRYHQSFMEPLINDDNFSVGQLGPRLVQLMTFSGYAIFDGPYEMKIEELIEKLDQMGFRPATGAEVLTLGAQYPELQEQFWIVALGDAYDSRFVCLDHNGIFRGVRLAYAKDVRCVRCYRFAAVRK